MHDNPTPAQPPDGQRKPTPTDREPIEVTHADLPLHCPMDWMTLWDSHPRVFLPIEESGREVCPYCSAEYVLRNESG